jgi:DNA repair protein RecO (recombination protein O)
MSTPRTADAVVLRLVDYSDTSQIVTFWSREAGRLTGIAKGAKRAKTAFHGPFDVFARHRLVYREKPAGRMHLLTAADLTDPHMGLRADPLRLAAAGYCAEILLGLTADGLPIPPLFDLLEETLSGLAGRGARGPGADPGDGTASGLRPPPSEDVWVNVLFRFEAQALTHLGHRPRVGGCASCGKGIDRFALFSPRSGGALCGRCAGGESAPLRVRAETLRVLDGLTEPGTPASERAYPAPIRQELRALLRSAYTYLLERPPVALGMLP